MLTAIVSRNFSHLYVKNLTKGEPDIELSPEETHAVAAAFAEPGEAPTPPAPPAPTRIVSGADVEPEVSASTREESAREESAQEESAREEASAR